MSRRVVSRERAESSAARSCGVSGSPASSFPARRLVKSSRRRAVVCGSGSGGGRRRPSESSG
ncbi:MAG TPA: hypothetical protein VGV38_10690, partial [Pyrinomonadaceae bacterium]|nr:hypothetical protein [Pyrinomonadaceae bacterium]